MTDESIVIIGAGPAGIAAAVQLVRSGHDPLVIEMGRPGGLLRTAWRVENYPGYPDGIPGPELAFAIARGLVEWNVRVTQGEVTGLDIEDDVFTVNTGDGAMTARRVIVATGTEPVPFECPGLDGLPKECVHRNIEALMGSSGLTVVIVGGGDAAFDHALCLAERGNEAVILNRSDGTSCLPLLLERTGGSPGIVLHDSTSISHVAWRDGRLAVTTGGHLSTEMKADHLVAAVGRVARDGLISERLRGEADRLRAEGLLYLIGDVANGRYRQAAIAAGDGVRAAMEIHAGSTGETE